MIKAGKMANHLNHPIILDPVGVGASTLRKEAAKKLLKKLILQLFVEIFPK